MNICFADGVNSHFFRLSDSLDTLTVESAKIANPTYNRPNGFIKIAYDYVKEPLIAIDLSRSTQSFAVVESLHSFSLGGVFQQANQWSLSVNLPMHVSTLSDTYRSGNFEKSNFGMGDMHLAFKYVVTQDPERKNFLFAFNPFLFIPTGQTTYFTSDDSFSYGLNMLMTFLLGESWDLNFNLGYSNAQNAEFLSIDRKNRADIKTGLSYKINDHWAILGENQLSIVFPYETDQNPVQFLLAARYTGKKKSRWFAGTGFDSLSSSRSGKYHAFAAAKIPFIHQEPKKPEPVKKVTPPPPPPPAPIKVIPTPTPRPTPKPKPKVEVKYVDPIFFEVNSAKIQFVSYKTVDTMVKFIKEDPEIQHVIISAHTDSDGSAEYNLKLSTLRANAVKDYFLLKGVPENKLKVRGYGESKARVPNNSPANKALNRRVEFEFVTGNKIIRMINR